VLRFQAARYESHIYVNGKLAVNHSGGHLPFEVDITPFIPRGASYSKMRVVVTFNTTLTSTTLPPGKLHGKSPAHRELETPFDFFNYDCIDHSVILYSTSSTDIQDIAIDTQNIDFCAYPTLRC